MINGLDLFSGIGGMSFALREFVRPIAYCEIDVYCQGVLLANMAKRRIGKAPIWDDIKTMSRLHVGIGVDIIYAGFPCQDISIANHGKGLAGERSGLFFEIIRLAQDLKPTFIFLENTKGILSNGGVEVVETLTSIGYDCRWITKSCKEVGSPQNRERWFCLAYSKSQRCEAKRFSMREEKTKPRPNSGPEYEIPDERKESPPPFYRVDDDLSFRVDRTRALGNSVCIEQTKEAFKELVGMRV